MIAKSSSHNHPFPAALLQAPNAQIPLHQPQSPAINYRMTLQNDTLLATILNWIDIGRLNPGDVIDEQPLVEECGVSRTPVREALL